MGLNLNSHSTRFARETRIEAVALFFDVIKQTHTNKQTKMKK